MRAEGRGEKGGDRFDGRLPGGGLVALVGFERACAGLRVLCELVVVRVRRWVSRWMIAVANR
jgi:hypothetical protein